MERNPKTCRYQGMRKRQSDRALDGHRRGSWQVTDVGFLSDTEDLWPAYDETVVHIREHLPPDTLTSPPI
jgi:hypothetical protein